MSEKWRAHPGVQRKLRTFETDLSCRLEWMCTDTSAVADLDLSCALYDFKGELQQVIDFNNLTNYNGSVLLCGDSIQSAKSGHSMEEIYMDLDRMTRRTKAVVLIASSLSGNLSSVFDIKSSITRLYFADDDITGVRPRPKWETSRLIDQQLICEGPMDSTTKNRQCNSIALWKLVREQRDTWTLSFEAVPFFSGNQKERWKFCEEHILVETFPWLKVEEQRFLPTVAAVCAALSSLALPALKPHFCGRNKRRTGLKINEFVKVLFKQLVTEHGELLVMKEATHVVALLHELFRQIDVNGDGSVDWEEFSGYVIDEGVLATRSGNSAWQEGPARVHYVEDKTYSEQMEEQARLAPAAQVVALVELTTSRRVLVLEQDSVFFKLYNSRGAHVGKYTAEATTSQRSRDACTIYDAAFVSERNIICLSCSDQCISLVLERHDGNCSEPKGYNFLGKLVHNALHRKMHWSSLTNRLISTTTGPELYFWDIDKLELAMVQDMGSEGLILEVIVLKDKALIAASFLDGTIKLYSEENLRQKAVLQGHKLGVRAMAYSQNTLLSGGFEYDVLSWDVSNKELSSTLRGHKHPILQIQMMTPVVQRDELLAITADEIGEFRVWDLIRTYGGFASLIQVFHVPGVEELRPLAGFALAHDPRASHEAFSNLFVGVGPRALHYIPRPFVKPFVPPRCALYSDAARRFFVSVGSDIYVYDANVGKLIRTFGGLTSVTSSITCACLDHPRDRRMFLGDEHGNLLVANILNGAILCRVNLHRKEITNIAYCGRTGYIITTGGDGRTCLTVESKGCVEPMRVIEEAHKASITCLCYSQRLAMIATSSSDGFCHIFDFESTRNVAPSIRANREITAVLLADQWSLLITGDVDGFVTMWYIDRQAGAITAVRHLALGGPSASPITVLSMLPRQWEDATLWAGTEGGDVLYWASLEPIIDSVNAANLTRIPIRALSDRECPGHSDRLNPHVKSTRNLGQYNLASVSVALGRTSRGPAEPIGYSAPTLVFKAHCDVVLVAYTVPEPPALVTVSNDGYQRMWSFSGQCLGEICLPSVDAQRRMERDQLMAKVEYKYCHEEMAVSTDHQQLATTLLMEEREASDARAAAGKRTGLSLRLKQTQAEHDLPQPLTIKTRVSTAAPDRTIARHNKPRARGPGSIDLGTTDMGATGMFSTMPAMNTVGFNVVFDTMSMANTMGGTARFRQSVLPQQHHRRQSRAGSVSVNKFEHATTAQQALEQLNEQASDHDVHSTHQSLWSAGSLKRKVYNRPGKGSHAAFSTHSLLSGAEQGLYDLEALQKFMYIDRHPDRQVLYDHLYPWSFERTQEVLRRGLQLTSDVRRGRSSDEFSRRYKNVKALLESGHVAKNPAMSSVFRSSDNRQLELKRLRLESNVHCQPKLYTCERVALTDEQILAPEADAVARRPVMTESSRPLSSTSCLSVSMSPPQSPKQVMLVDEPAVLKRIQDALATSDESPETEDNVWPYPLQQLLRTTMMSTKAPSATAPPSRGQTASTKLSSNAPPITQRVPVHRTRRRSSLLSTQSNEELLKADKITVQDIRPGFFGPYYTVLSIMQFRELFNKVDDNLNGRLDREEWAEFLESMNHDVPPVLYQKLFLTVDKNKDGAVSVEELVPIVFNQATKLQQQVILKLIESENRKVQARDTLKEEDVLRLFEYMDESHKGCLTAEEVERALDTLQVSPAKMIIVQEQLRHELEKEWSKDEFVSLVWPLVAG